MTAAMLPFTSRAVKPSDATLPAFFAAAAKPLVLSQSTAASKSPDVSTRAFFAVHHSCTCFFPQIFY